MGTTPELRLLLPIPRTAAVAPIIGKIFNSLFFSCIFASVCFAAVDTAPPTGTIVINANQPYATSITVTLTLSASDTGSGVYMMRFSNNKSNWSTPELYRSTKTWSLTSGNGTRTVYVKFQDKAGNWSGVFSDSIVLDTTPPSGAISINDNSKYTNKAVITLKFSAVDNGSGLAQMCFSNDNKTWTSPQAYAATEQWTLAPSEGTKTVYAKFRDIAGNWSAAISKSIIYDVSGPKGSISVNKNAISTVSYAVTLTLSASDTYSGAAQMQLSNDNITWPNPEPYKISKSWTLASGNGTKTVYARFIDKAGNYSVVYSDSIVVDTTPPSGTIKINNDSQYTKLAAVTLNLSAQDSGSGMGAGAQMQFSNDNKTWTSPEVYAVTKAWTLTSGDAAKTVYAKFKDAAGNWSSAYSNTIILDTAKPAIAITDPQNGTVITGP